MAFTYDPSTNAGKVRLYLGDSVEDAGPRPNNNGVVPTNYSDQEIDLFLTMGDVSKALVLGFRTLAGEWRPFALSERGSIESMDAKATADGFLAQAKYWEKNPIDVIGQNKLLIDLDRDDVYTEE